jgi:hypothetical protein
MLDVASQGDSGLEDNHILVLVVRHNRHASSFGPIVYAQRMVLNDRILDGVRQLDGHRYFGDQYGFAFADQIASTTGFGRA